VLTGAKMITNLDGAIVRGIARTEDLASRCSPKGPTSFPIATGVGRPTVPQGVNGSGEATSRLTGVASRIESRLELLGRIAC